MALTRSFVALAVKAYSLQPTSSLGSGVIIDANRYCYNHVIEDDEIMVTLRDGRRFRATVVGTDEDTDAAVIPSLPRMARPLLSPTRTVSVGDFVVAIGNLSELGQTEPQELSVRWGVLVSASKATKTSFRPMRRSTSGIPVAR